MNPRLTGRFPSGGCGGRGLVRDPRGRESVAAVRGRVQETLLRPAPRILQRLVTLPHPQLVFRSTGSGEQGGGGVLLRRAWGGGAASRRSPGRQEIRRVAGSGAVVQVRGRRPGGRGVVWKVDADTRKLVREP